MPFFGVTKYRLPVVRIPSVLLNISQIEYLVVAIDDEHQKVRLSLCQAEVLKALARDEELSRKGAVVPDLQDACV